MSTIATIATIAGFIAGIRYPSGRCIYARNLPMRGHFTEHASLACVWPDRAAAQQAQADLLKAFEVRNPGALELFITEVEP